MMSSPADLWARIQDCERAQAKLESEKALLKDKINELNNKVSELNNILRDRERCIQDLNRKLVCFSSILNSCKLASITGNYGCYNGAWMLTNLIIKFTLNFFSN